MELMNTLISLGGRREVGGEIKEEILQDLQFLLWQMRVWNRVHEFFKEGKSDPLSRQEDFTSLGMMSGFCSVLML